LVCPPPSLFSNENTDTPLFFFFFFFSSSSSSSTGARAVDGAEISSKFSNRAMMLLDICARQIFQTPPCRETRTAPEGDLSGGNLAVFIGLAEGLILWHEYWIACNQFDAIRHFQPFLIRLWDDLSFAYMIPSTSSSLNAERKNQVIARILLRLAGHEQLLARLAGNEVEEMYEFALTITSLVTPIDHTFLFVFRTMARINALENLNEALWCTDKLQEAFEEWETKEVLGPSSAWLLPGIAFCLSAAKALIYDKTKMPRLSEKWSAKAHLQLKSPHFNVFFPAVGCCVAFLFTVSPFFDFSLFLPLRS
jgi:hypothetical protein